MKNNYLIYKNKCKKLLSILNSSVIKSTLKYEDKNINNIISKYKFANFGTHNAGAVFLGYLDDNKLRILCSKEQRKYNNTYIHVLNIVGGNIEPNETILRGLIREILEEVFNIKVKKCYVDKIEEYIRSIDCYEIINLKLDSYTYIFDIAILGKFLEFVSRCGNKDFDKYILKDNIDIVKYIKERKIPKEIPKNGLNEVLSLGFEEFNKLKYNILNNPSKCDFFNMKTNEIEQLKCYNVLEKIIKLL